MRGLIIAVIRAWRMGISLFLAPSCRFYPSCSAYAETAVHRHGALRGCWLTLCRIARCHPWHAGGHDPVPPCPGDPGTGEVTDAQSPAVKGAGLG